MQADAALSFHSTFWALSDSGLGRARGDAERILARMERGPSAGPFGPFSRPQILSREGTDNLIRVGGILTHRPAVWSGFVQSTSYMEINTAVTLATLDPTCKRIVLEFDSPGGTVAGVIECARTIAAATERKPVIAMINSTCASAAYWLASQCSQIVITPGGEVGSIGVLAMHVDESAANEKAGIAVSYISAGAYKTEGNPHEPLGDDARRYMQSRVDAYYDDFCYAVCIGRSMAGRDTYSLATVRDKFGKGRVMGSRDALLRGLVDRIAPIDAILAQPRRRYH